MEQVLTNAEVTQDGILVASVSGRMTPGRHRVSIRIVEEPKPNKLPKIIPLHLGGSAGQTWRREDMYGDDGR